MEFLAELLNKAQSCSDQLMIDLYLLSPTLSATSGKRGNDEAKAQLKMDCLP